MSGQRIAWWADRELAQGRPTIRDRGRGNVSFRYQVEIIQRRRVLRLAPTRHVSPTRLAAARLTRYAA
jgi:hypothetical protein